MAAPVPAGLGMTSCWDPTDLPRAGDGSPVPAGLGMTSCWDPTDLPRPGDDVPAGLLTRPNMLMRSQWSAQS